MTDRAVFAGPARKKPVEFGLPAPAQVLGKCGEDTAADYLESSGYSVVDSNAGFEGGEIDIVALLGRSLVFVEVKTRRGSGFGVAEAVSPRKMMRMRRAAGAWLASNSVVSWESVRFDVITVVIRPSGAPEITHYEAVDRGAC